MWQIQRFCELGNGPPYEAPAKGVERKYQRLPMHESKRHEKLTLQQESRA